MIHNDYKNAVSKLSVSMSKADVTRLSNFRKVLKNSVLVSIHTVPRRSLCIRNKTIKLYLYHRRKGVDMFGTQDHT